jgi:hypothetical protein
MISRDDAFLIFDKLFRDKTRLVVLGDFTGCTVILRGAISTLTRERVGVLSHNGKSGLSLSFDIADLLFEYREPKDFPIAVPLVAKETVCLTAGFRGARSVPDKLIFLEVPAEADIA